MVRLSLVFSPSLSFGRLDFIGDSWGEFVSIALERKSQTTLWGKYLHYTYCRVPTICFSETVVEDVVDFSEHLRCAQKGEKPGIAGLLHASSRK